MGLQILHAARDGGPARGETSKPVSRHQDRLFARAGARHPELATRVNRNCRATLEWRRSGRWAPSRPGSATALPDDGGVLRRVAAGRAIGPLTPSELRPLPSHTWKGPLLCSRLCCLPVWAELSPASWSDTPFRSPLGPGRGGFDLAEVAPHGGLGGVRGPGWRWRPRRRCARSSRAGRPPRGGRPCSRRTAASAKRRWVSATARKRSAEIRCKALPPVYQPVNCHLTCIDVHWGLVKILSAGRFAQNDRHDRRSTLPYDFVRTPAGPYRGSSTRRI